MRLTIFSFFAPLYWTVWYLIVSFFAWDLSWISNLGDFAIWARILLGIWTCGWLLWFLFWTVLILFGTAKRRIR